MVAYGFDTDDYKVTSAVQLPHGGQFTFNAFLDRGLAKRLSDSKLDKQEVKYYQEMGESVLAMNVSDSIQLPDLTGKRVYNFTQRVFPDSCSTKNTRLIRDCRVPQNTFRKCPSLNIVMSHLNELGESDIDYDCVRFDSYQVPNQEMADLLTRVWVEYIDAAIDDLNGE